MNWSETARRVVALTFAVLCLLIAPQVAQATFGSRQQPSLAVGTATLVAPTGVTGTFNCSQSGSTESVSVNVAGFTDAGPSGSSYVYRLTATGQVAGTTTTTARTATVTGSRLKDATATTWTLTINASLRAWTGPLFSTSFVCRANNSTSGTL